MKSRSDNTSGQVQGGSGQFAGGQFASSTSPSWIAGPAGPSIDGSGSGDAPHVVDVQSTGRPKPHASMLAGATSGEGARAHSSYTGQTMSAGKPDPNAAVCSRH